MGSNPFATSMTPMEDDEDQDDDDATEDGDGSEESGVSPNTSGISADPTTSGGSDPSSTTGDGGGSTTGPVIPPGTTTSGVGVEESSSSTGSPPPDGSQPDTGMYAHCYEDFFDNCTAPSTICVNVTGEMDGYCTADGCMNPALDCDIEPGGNAPAFCLAEAGVSVCALDCSGGQSCATGMECRTVSFDGVTDYDICM